jgi:hypothetical protein
VLVVRRAGRGSVTGACWTERFRRSQRPMIATRRGREEDRQLRRRILLAEDRELGARETETLREVQGDWAWCKLGQDAFEVRGGKLQASELKGVVPETAAEEMSHRAVKIGINQDRSTPSTSSPSTGPLRPQRRRTPDPPLRV